MKKLLKYIFTSRQFCMGEIGIFMLVCALSINFIGDFAYKVAIFMVGIFLTWFMFFVLSLVWKNYGTTTVKALYSEKSLKFREVMARAMPKFATLGVAYFDAAQIWEENPGLANKFGVYITVIFIIIAVPYFIYNFKD